METEFDGKKITGKFGAMIAGRPCQITVHGEGPEVFSTLETLVEATEPRPQDIQPIVLGGVKWVARCLGVWVRDANNGANELMFKLEGDINKVQLWSFGVVGYRDSMQNQKVLRDLIELQELRMLNSPDNYFRCYENDIWCGVSEIAGHLKVTKLYAGKPKEV